MKKSIQLSFNSYMPILILYLATQIIIGCNSGRESYRDRLERYSVSGETSKIADMIIGIDSQLATKNLGRGDKFQKLDKAESAISEILKNQKERSNELFNIDSLYQDLVTREIKSIVIEALNENGLSLNDRTLICNQYLKEPNQDLADELLSMITRQDELKLYDKCFQLRNKFTNDNNNNNNKLFQERLEKMIEFIPFRSMSDNKFNDWITDKEQWLKFQNAQKKYSSLKERQKIIEEDIKELEQEIDEANFTTLTGVIVEKLGVYNSRHMYKIVSSRTAKPSLLTTKETIFNSQGAFRLYVKKSGEIPYKSRLGFEKKFDAFVEVTQEDREALAETKERLEQLNKSIEKIYTEKNETQNFLSKLSSQVEEDKNKEENNVSLDFTYQSSQIHLDIQEISLGMSIREAESKFGVLRKVEGYSNDFGFGGGGTAYLYYDGEELLFGLIPGMNSDKIIAIILISSNFSTSNGLNPKSTARQISKIYPEIKVRKGALNGWEYISKNSRNWTFVFMTDGSKTVGEYAESMPKPPSELINLDIKADWVTIK